MPVDRMADFVCEVRVPRDQSLQALPDFAIQILPLGLIVSREQQVT
jgi:hypothetical protein